MTAHEILAQLQALGSASYKRVMLNHGVEEPVFGVKIEELKKIQKKVKKDHRLACDLFATGVHEAQYLAGLIADDAKMTKKELQTWVKASSSAMISEYTVPWVAAESQHGWDLALDWIDSAREPIAAAGWATLAGLVVLKDDAELDLAALKALLQRVEKTIHSAPNRVRYTMNNFVIAVGCGVKELTAAAEAAAKRIGTVQVDMGKTACKVPSALEYIDKVRKRGALGKKRKTVKC